MITAIEAQVPHSNEALRQALYAGRIFQLASTAASLHLVDAVYALIEAELGPDPRHVQHRMSDVDLFHAVGRIRKTLFLDQSFHQAARAVIAAAGFDPGRIAFDPLRLRVITHRGHENPRARAVYYPHRDTWYGHSQSIITWWIPLDDLANNETFVLYPERFAAAVPNDSEIFDYDEWVRRGWGLKIGWQDRNAGLEARYPGVIGEVDGGLAVGVSCTRGQNLLFSGAHFHRTLPQETGRSRFSLDFRIVHIDDHARGLGAPNVDNRSRGSALIDYIQPASVHAP